MTDTNEPCIRSEADLKIACGSGHVDINLSKPADVIEIQVNKPEMTDGQIMETLEGEGVYSFGINEIVEDAEKILLILPDATRKSGAERFLPQIIEKIEAQGKQFSLIVAVGTHRQPTEDELKIIFTPDTYEKHKDKLIEHDCENYDEMDFYGVTKRKTTILINKAYREHDTIITIGSVSYHYFAGYGGGRKLIVPGLASKKTIMNNHKLALNTLLKQRDDKAVTGNLKHNPVNDDLVEMVMISRSAHTFFAVNTLLGSKGEITDMVCGDIFMSHMQAADRLDEISSVDASKKYDVVYLSAGGSPKDINMVQAQKSLDRIIPLLKEGAKVLFFAECVDGYGNSYFEEFFDRESADIMLNELLDDYQINRQTAYNLKSNLEKYDVYLYSEFDKSACERMGFKKLIDADEAAKFADEAENVAFIPQAYNIYPAK